MLMRMSNVICMTKESGKAVHREPTVLHTVAPKVLNNVPDLNRTYTLKIHTVVELQKRNSLANYTNPNSLIKKPPRNLKLT